MQVYIKSGGTYIPSSTHTAPLPSSSRRPTAHLAHAGHFTSLDQGAPAQGAPGTSAPDGREDAGSEEPNVHDRAPQDGAASQASVATAAPGASGARLDVQAGDGRTDQPASSGAHAAAHATAQGGAVAASGSGTRARAAARVQWGPDVAAATYAGSHVDGPTARRPGPLQPPAPAPPPRPSPLPPPSASLIAGSAAVEQVGGRRAPLDLLQEQYLHQLQLQQQRQHAAAGRGGGGGGAATAAASGYHVLQPDPAEVTEAAVADLHGGSYYNSGAARARLEVFQRQGRLTAELTALGLPPVYEHRKGERWGVTAAFIDGASKVG